MRILGIDPGCYGALALLDGDQLVRVVDMPRIMVRRGKTDKAEVGGHELGEILRELAPDLVVLEQVYGVTGQSASAAFNFGRACGVAEGACKALGRRVEMAPPASWKRALGLAPGKDAARAMAVELWPEHVWLFKRVKDADRAEAALIALWGYRKFGGAG
jgi:Holliday junction resolvasome RuvABC endonuclease subunit